MKLKPTSLARITFLFRRDARKILLRFVPLPKRAATEERFKLSAYLSVYNDWDILGSTLKSVAKYVDELIVVDGAYEWMAPFLAATGCDPTRSDRRVYDTLTDSGIPFRCINGTWKNEVEKRIAGYSACTHRFVLRVDADEVLFFNDKNLEAFLASGCAVAEMDMPTYVAPGWILRTKRLRDIVRKFPSQRCLFDKTKISAEGHLKYLWLVIPADTLPSAKQKTYSVFERPIAFCAHLTGWRTADTAVQRSAFYTMNWMRKHGALWWCRSSEAPIEDFEEFFRLIPPTKFKEILKRGILTQGTIGLVAKEALAESPLSPEQEESLKEHYLSFLSSLSAQNLSAAREAQTMILGEPVFFDISTNTARSAIADAQAVRLITSPPLTRVRVVLHTLAARAPMSTRETLSAIRAGQEVRFELPHPNPSRNALRQVIELAGWVGGQDGLCSFRVALPGASETETSDAQDPELAEHSPSDF